MTSEPPLSSGTSTLPQAAQVGHACEEVVAASTTIHDLPSELLQQIFYFYARLAIDRQWRMQWALWDYRSGEWYPWTILGRVCRLWQSMVSREPKLWSNLYLPAPRRTWETVLEFAKAHPISLIIDETRWPLEPLPDPIPTRLEAGQVDELYLRVYYERAIRQVASILPIAYPRLSRLYLGTVMPVRPGSKILFPPESSEHNMLLELRVHQVALAWERMSDLRMLEALCITYADGHLVHYKLEVPQVL
jgi:hypothetical protein